MLGPAVTRCSTGSAVKLIASPSLHHDQPRHVRRGHRRHRARQHRAGRCAAARHAQARGAGVMTADPRFTYARATSGYDPEFERALVDAITITIAQSSHVSDANVMAIRTGET